MSTNFSLTDGDGNDNDDILRGLVLVATILLFLFCLVALRLFCNVFIDVIILGDGRSLMRSLSELRRSIFPSWHPRTQPDDSTQHGGGRNQEGNNATTELIDMESLLSGLTPSQKQQLLESIVNSKVRIAVRVKLSPSPVVAVR
jgi:hypothetical protein